MGGAENRVFFDFTNYALRHYANYERGKMRFANYGGGRFANYAREWSGEKMDGETTKNESGGGWEEGFPAARGWYDCMIDEKRVTLLLFICQMSGRREWVTPGGDYVTGEGVRWRGAPLSPPVL